jgi:4-hydroxy-4-methyl-2-oxoglutarate aldolase
VTAAALVSFGTATLGEAWPTTRIVDAPLRPVSSEMTMAGPALTVRCRPGDNLALHRAIAQARGGEVLLVDYGGNTETGPFGEIMALACQMRGIAGMVIDGAVRDSARIAALGFPVFARGVNIRGTTKVDRGEIGVPILLGGVRVAPGDIVLADADAIAVIAQDDLAAASAAATVRVAKEHAMMDRIRQGETTLSILGLMEGHTT